MIPTIMMTRFKQFFGFYKKPFTWVLLLVTGVYFMQEVLNGRFGMHDFEVYYSAARAFLNGTPVYGKAFGLSSGFFKYTPASLLLFIPLAILPFLAAKIIWYMLVCFFTISVFLLSEKIVAGIFFESKEKSLLSVLLLVLVVAGGHVIRELELGNVNMLLLCLFLFSFVRLGKRQDILAGLCIAAGILIKPHFLVLLPLLLVRGRYKALGVCLLTLGAGICLPYVFAGLEGGQFLNQQWIQALKAHNQDILSYPDTLYSLLYKGGLKLLFPEQGKTLVLILLTLVGLGFLLLIHFNKKREKKHQPALSGSAGFMGGKQEKYGNSPGFCFEYFLLMASIPNLTATDTEHFLFSIPLLVFVFRYLWESRTYIYLAALVTTCIFSYADFGSDIIGKPASVWIELNGLTGLGNLAILTVGLILYIRWDSRQVEFKTRIDSGH
jgi:hypothetical protein